MAEANKFKYGKIMAKKFKFVGIQNENVQNTVLGTGRGEWRRMKIC